METSLHRELKEFYCDDEAAREVSVQGFRIDAVVDGTLIEIQQASLAALRQKTKVLLETHSVTIVKPLCCLKTIIRLKRKKGLVASTRTSPRHETIFSMFDDLVHFVDVFPHPNLTLEVLLTEQEETVSEKPLFGRRISLSPTEARRRYRHAPSTNPIHPALLAGLADTFTTAAARLARFRVGWRKMAYCRRTGA